MKRLPSRRRQAIAWVVLVLGLSLSVAAALAWRSHVEEHGRQGFETAATDVTKTLQTLLGRDEDFVGTLRAVLTMHPHMSASELRRWLVKLEARRREVGGLGITVLDRVPADRLAAFQARRDADPAYRALVRGRVRDITPSGRSRYCLISAGESTKGGLSPDIARLLQGDWCAPGSPIGRIEAPLLRAVSASGRFLAIPVYAQGVHTVFFHAVYYTPDAAPKTAAQRRGATAGWVLSSFDVPAIVRQAVGGHGDISVALYHGNPGRPESLLARVSVGDSGPFAYGGSLNVNGSWRVVVHGSVPPGGMSAGLQALLVLAGGATISLLLFALVLVLVRSRARALGMVEQKTGQLRHQALHDALTGLPNRILAIDRAEQMLARARRQQLPVAALFVDIDGFKNVNDTFGHAAGDSLLSAAASRLSSVVREGDTAARLGGDEFVVLVEGATLQAGPELVAERLLEVLRQPYVLSDSGRQLSLTASIGIASGLRESAEVLLRDADLALYEAKTAGRNRYVAFRSAMQEAAQDRLTLEMDLAEALDRDELFLLYQPTFDLQSESVSGVEALIRWAHPRRGTLAPAEFIPLAEDTGLIVPIGRWALREACRRAAAWHADGKRVGVAVNVSARQLDTDGLLEDVRRALEHSRIEPQLLTIEVTETTLMHDPEATARRLHALKGLGVRIAIDDFGTGYSSLAYLRQFPADALKIDRSFISGIAASEQSTALIHTLVQLGKTLHIETLAEGIEDREQLEALQREHCDQGQGFLFSRPLDADAMTAFLQTARAPLGRSRPAAQPGRRS